MSNKYTGPTPLLDRFNAKVDRSGGPDACWPWLGCTNGSGYGVIGSGGRGGPNILTHRLAWEIANGAVPEGQCVLHNCPGGDNRACCNPRHHLLGTRPQNMADKVAKGRQPRGEDCKQAKLNADDVRLIRRLHDEEGATIGALAARFGVHRITARSLIRRETWKHVA